MVDVTTQGVIGTLREIREHLRVLTKRRTTMGGAYGFVVYLRDAGVLTPAGERLERGHRKRLWRLPDGALHWVATLDLTGSNHDVAERLNPEARYLHRYYAATFLRKAQVTGRWYA